MAESAAGFPDPGKAYLPGPAATEREEMVRAFSHFYQREL